MQLEGSGLLVVVLHEEGAIFLLIVLGGRLVLVVASAFRSRKPEFRSD